MMRRTAADQQQRNDSGMAAERQRLSSRLQRDWLRGMGAAVGQTEAQLAWGRRDQRRWPSGPHKKRGGPSLCAASSDWWPSWK
jgi:hypothetical protein